MSLHNSSEEKRNQKWIFYKLVSNANYYYNQNTTQRSGCVLERRCRLHLSIQTESES